MNKLYILTVFLCASSAFAQSATVAIEKDSTDVSIVIRIVDDADGTPETGVVFNTSGIDLEYWRPGSASTDITEATLASLSTAHADGGFLHIGNGYYRLDLPDAAVATGVDYVLVHGTVTDMIVIGTVVPLTTTEGSLTTIMNRLGSWTGSGQNTILGAFQALMRKDADAVTPSDINSDLGSGAGTANNVTDSQEAISESVDYVRRKP